jgi:hypothetical protein
MAASTGGLLTQATQATTTPTAPLSPVQAPITGVNAPIRTGGPIQGTGSTGGTATIPPITSSPGNSPGMTSGTGGQGITPAPTVPSLNSLYPTTPTAGTATGSNATATQIGNIGTASATNTLPLAAINNGQINPNDATNAASQVDAITNANSPYIQLAEQQGLLSAASRGLENSSIGAGSSEAAAVAAAAPLATQNASEASSGALQNAQLQTQASEFNASQQAAAQELAAQLGTGVSEQNAQVAAQTSQFNAAAQNTMAQQTEAIEGSINQQYLSGTQAQDLAAIQGQYNELITSNQSAASLYGQYFSSIGSIMANQNISPDRVADSISAQQAMLESGLSVIDQLNGMSVDLDLPTTSGGSGSDFTTVGPTSTSGTSTSGTSNSSTSIPGITISGGGTGYSIPKTLPAGAGNSETGDYPGTDIPEVPIP